MSKKLKIPASKRTQKLRLFSFEDKEDIAVSPDVKSHIEIISNEEITIEMCRGILDYNEEYIKLRLLKGGVILFGSDLYITYFENGIIRIKGKFTSVEFCV